MQIQEWIGDLSHTDPRRRREAQAGLEKLPRELHVLTAELLTDKPDLEYSMRRRRIFAIYFHGRSLEDRIVQQIIAYRKTGKCEFPGFAAFSRIVGSEPGNAEIFIALQHASRDFFLMVYAAPRYADDAVTRQLVIAGDSQRSRKNTHANLASELTSLFFVLCDKDVAVNEKQISRGLGTLQESKQSISNALNDPEFGPVLRKLIRRFIDDAGERDDNFLRDARERLDRELSL